ncbi:hypothetical protein CLOM_g16211 [Closterium sp. NIES-68]|nr:hypothetical protein CLOM_g16211 [Closterium sp. NIES-68]
MMDSAHEQAESAPYSAPRSLTPASAAAVPIQEHSPASAAAGSAQIVAGLAAASAGPSLTKGRLYASSGPFVLPGAVPCGDKAASSPGALAGVVKDLVSPLQAPCSVAVAPHASVECTAQSNLARSLSISRSRRAREKPQLQPHEECEERPGLKEREGAGVGGIRGRGGRGMGRKGTRGVERKGLTLGAEGGRARGVSIEQLEAAGRAETRPDGSKRVFWSNGRGGRRGGGHPRKQQRLLPSEDEVKEAATDWSTLGATLSRALGVGSDLGIGGALGIGGSGGEEDRVGQDTGVAQAQGWRVCERQGAGERVAGYEKVEQVQQPKAQEELGSMWQQDPFQQQQQQQQKQQHLPLFSMSGVPGIGGLWKGGGFGVGPKVDFECRFCGTGFDSPRALGGHMNLHRRERKLEDTFLQQAETQARADLQLRQQQQQQQLLQQQQQLLQQQQEQQQQRLQLYQQEQHQQQLLHHHQEQQQQRLQLQQQEEQQQHLQLQKEEQQEQQLQQQQGQQRLLLLLQQQEQQHAQQEQQNQQQQLLQQQLQQVESDYQQQLKELHQQQQQQQQQLQQHPRAAAQAPLLLSPDVTPQQQHLIPAARRFSFGLSNSTGSRASAEAPRLPSALPALSPPFLTQTVPPALAPMPPPHSTPMASPGVSPGMGASAGMVGGAFDGDVAACMGPGWRGLSGVGGVGGSRGVGPNGVNCLIGMDGLCDFSGVEGLSGVKGVEGQLASALLKQFRGLEGEQMHIDPQSTLQCQMQQQLRQQQHLRPQQQQQQQQQQSVFTWPKPRKAVSSRRQKEEAPSSLPQLPLRNLAHTPNLHSIHVPMGQSTQTNPSAPHHPLLPPPSPDPFLSTLSPEVLQSLFLHSRPPGTGPTVPVTPRAVTTASSFAPARPASVSPPLPPMPANALLPVATCSQQQPPLDPTDPTVQLLGFPPAVLAALIASGVRPAGVTSGVSSGRTVSAPPVAGAEDQQRSTVGERQVKEERTTVQQQQQHKQLQHQQRQQQQWRQQQPMEIPREGSGEGKTLQVRSGAGAEGVQRSRDDVAWLRPHGRQQSVQRQGQQQQQQQQQQQGPPQQQELLSQLLALAGQQEPCMGGLLGNEEEQQQGERQQAEQQQQGESGPAAACGGLQNVVQGGGGGGEGSLHGISALDWLLAASHLHGLTVPGVTVPGVTVPGVTVPGVTVPGVTVPGATVPGVTMPGVAMPEPSPVLPYLTSGPLGSALAAALAGVTTSLVTPSLVTPSLVAEPGLTTAAAAAPLVTPQFGSSAGGVTSHGPLGAGVTSESLSTGGPPCPIVSAPSIPPAYIPPFRQQHTFPSLQHPSSLCESALSQQQEARTLARQPVHGGEVAGGTEEEEFARLEQLHQLLLLQEQLIGGQSREEELQLRRQGLRGVSGAESSVLKLQLGRESEVTGRGGRQHKMGATETGKVNDPPIIMDGSTEE